MCEGSVHKQQGLGGAGQAQNLQMLAADTYAVVELFLGDLGTQ